uniref:uncharacterized protein LOC120334645 n=1 Tax=Styela clava TaxID=7725 RepID=UPI001939E55C|nr:uncharacterized protein LOC120334645 [Styela clava]
MSSQNKEIKDCSNPESDLNTAHLVSEDESSADTKNLKVFNTYVISIPPDDSRLRGPVTYSRDGLSEDMEKSVSRQPAELLDCGSSQDDLLLHAAENRNEDGKKESASTDVGLSRPETENSVLQKENRLEKATGNLSDNGLNPDQKKKPDLELSRMGNTEVETRKEEMALENERLPISSQELNDTLRFQWRQIAAPRTSKNTVRMGNCAIKRIPWIDMRDTGRLNRATVIVDQDKASYNHENTTIKPFYSSNPAEKTETVALKEQDEKLNEPDSIQEDLTGDVTRASETTILLVTEYDNEDESHDNTQDGDELNDVVGENENIGPSANNGNAGRLYGAGVIPPRGFIANMLGNADFNAGNLDHNIGNIKMENRSAIPVRLSDEKGNLLGDEAPIETEPKPPDSLDLDTGPDQHDAEIPTNKDSSDLTDSMEACTVCNDDKTISSDILKIQEKGNEKKDMVPPPLNPNNGSVAQPNIAPAPGIRGYLERYETYFDIPIYKRCPSLHLEQLARIGFKFIKPDPGQAGRIICTDCGKLHSFTDIIRRSPKNFVWHENGCSFENKRFPCDHCENLNVHEQDWEWCNECGQDILPVKAFSELEQHLQMIPEQQAQQNHAFISCLVCNQDVDSRQNVDTCTVCGGPLCICYGYHNH